MAGLGGSRPKVNSDSLQSTHIEQRAVSRMSIDTAIVDVSFFCTHGLLPSEYPSTLIESWTTQGLVGSQWCRFCKEQESLMYEKGVGRAMINSDT